MEEWASALSALCERSQPALRLLLAFLTCDSRITLSASMALFGQEDDCLCLHACEDHDWIVTAYLANNELVSSPS